MRRKSHTEGAVCTYNEVNVGGVNEAANTGTKGGNMKGMKIVSLCSSGTCCPVVKITDTQVEIGEVKNICVLTKTQWETLKQKIMDGEL